MDDMQNLPTNTGAAHLPAMSEDAIAKVRDLEALMKTCEQVEIPTEHLFHAGMYVRTIHVPAGVTIAGAELKVPTVVIVSGDCSVFIGEETLELRGYNVLPASAGRKQAFMAHSDVCITAFYPTGAQSIEEVERESTDEYNDLLSRRQDAQTLMITGE